MNKSFLNSRCSNSELHAVIAKVGGGVEMIMKLDDKDKIEEVDKTGEGGKSKKVIILLMI